MHAHTLMSCICYYMFSYRGLQFFPANGSLRIIRVQSFHAGVYRCDGLAITEQCRYFSDNATVTVRGMYD